MRRSRRQCALLLIAVFVLGGLLGPVVHQFDHAQTWADYSPPRISTQHAADGHPSALLQERDHAETDGSALCWLCTILQRGAALKITSTTPEQHAAAVRAFIGDSFLSPTVVLLFLSRAPPVVS